MKYQTHFLIRIAGVFLLLVTVFASCRENKKEESTSDKSAKRFEFRPLSAESDIPMTVYTVDATRDTTLFFSSGSAINIPAGTLTFPDGKPFVGKATVKYREMISPIEAMLAGVPLTFIENGKPGQLSTAGMFQITADDKGRELSIAKGKKVTVDFVSAPMPDKHFAYYFDQEKSNWIRLGDLSNRPVDTIAATKDKKQIVSEPRKPKLSTDDNRTLKLAPVDPAEFPELSVFKDVKFRILDECPLNSEDSKVTWNDVSIRKVEGRDMIYTLRFMKTEGRARAISYLVEPVYDKAEYPKAMAEYNKRFAEYKKMRDASLNQRKEQKDRFIQSQDEFFKQIKNEQQKDIKAQLTQKILDDAKKEDERKRMRAYYRGVKYRDSIYWTGLKESAEINTTSDHLSTVFSLEKFGTYNCDRPMELMYTEYSSPRLVDKKKNPVSIARSFLICFNNARSFREIMSQYLYYNENMGLAWMGVGYNKNVYYIDKKSMDEQFSKNPPKSGSVFQVKEIPFKKLNYIDLQNVLLNTGT